MNGLVSSEVITAITISLLAGILLPTALFVVLKFRCKFKGIPFLAGALTMLVGAFIIEQIFHSIVLKSPVGTAIMGNLWLYSIYGGFCAALFEEGSRYITMRYILKKYHGEKSASIMYGAGHGGFECFYLLVIGMISNLAMAITINSGAVSTLTNGLSGDALEQVNAAVYALTTTDAGLFFVGIFERIMAMAGQIAMSIFVWQAVTKKKFVFFAVSFLFHFFVDCVMSMINSYVGVFATEAFIAVSMIAFLICAIIVYRKDKEE